MRYFVSLIILVLVVNKVYSQDFVLKGKLEGFEEGTRIILNPFLENMDIDLDNETLLLLKDGKFEFSRHLDNPTKFSLRVRPKNPDNIAEYEQLTFWAENVRMTLTGTKGQIFQSIIQGSLIQDQYFQHISSIAKLENRTKEIVDSVKTLPNLGDDKKSEMSVRYHTALTTIEEKRTEFIFSNPNYYCTAAEVVFNITFTPGKIDQKRLKEWYGKMSPEVQSNTYGNQIRIFLKDKEIVKSQPLEVGDYPYNFVLKNSSGNEVKFSLINSKVILLDFWASSCGPCRSEHKNYVALYNEFRNSGFEIVSISQDQSEKRWIEAMTKDEMTWICLWDKNKKVSNDVYNISGLPTNYLILDGKIVAIDLRGKELRQKLESVLSQN